MYSKKDNNMQNLNIKNVILLFRFMLSFQINRFEVLKSNEKRIVALVGWGDDWDHVPTDT